MTKQKHRKSFEQIIYERKQFDKALRYKSRYIVDIIEITSYYKIDGDDKAKFSRGYTLEPCDICEDCKDFLYISHEFDVNSGIPKVEHLSIVEGIKRILKAARYNNATQIYRVSKFGGYRIMEFSKVSYEHGEEVFHLSKQDMFSVHRTRSQECIENCYVIDLDSFESKEKEMMKNE